MKRLFSALAVLVVWATSSHASARAEEKPPTVKDWIESKLTAIATGCIGNGNVKELKKKAPIVPQSLMAWPTLKAKLAATDVSIQQGSAGKFIGQVFDTSGATTTLLGPLSGTIYPPEAVARDGYDVTHVQNCMTMLAGKGDLKLSAAILQAALDASYDGKNTQALVLDGGTMKSAYAWALEDASTAIFPGIERTEVMLDIWAWHRNNPSHVANDKLRIPDTVSGIEAHLVRDISVASLLKGSVSASGGLPFLSGGAEANGSAKVLSSSTASGFETAVFSTTYRSMPTAAVLSARLEPRLRLVLDPANQVWFAGAPVKLRARLAPVPQTACQNTWVAENGTLSSVDWEPETRACRFDVTFSPARSTADTVTLAYYLKSMAGAAGGPSIRVGQDVVVSNEAAKISFAGVTPSLGTLPATGSAATMPLTLLYRVSAKQGRDLDGVTANDPLTFRCGGDGDTSVLAKDAHVASGTGTKDVMISIDVPASALKNIAQTPVRCTVGGTISVKSTGTGGTLVQDKTLPTFNFDLVRPATTQQGPQPGAG